MTGLFLDDFEAEARNHIDKIETAFLDSATLSEDSKLMDGVFRAAHSLKGTAGFFSLAKIVAVAHELESVLSQIKNGNLDINEGIIESVLSCVDCLKSLIDNIQDDDEVEIESIIDELRAHSSSFVEQGVEDNLAIDMPFDFIGKEPVDALKEAARFGQKIFYANIRFNRSLGHSYEHPELLIGSILSVGTIVETYISHANDPNAEKKLIKEPDADILMEKIVTALGEHDTSNIELLVTSILDYDLFLMAIEVDSRCVHQLQADVIFGIGKSKEILKSKGDASDKATQGKAADKTGKFSIRLDIATINGLVDLANEMILTRNQLYSTVADYRDTIDDLAPILHNLNRLTSEIQEKVMYTRMQPINVIFNKFPRIIHDTAKMLNKDIAINIVKDDVMLDKYMLESLTDPITQIVKNSADHGVEAPEKRRKSGKPNKGVITLDAYMQDGAAIIEIKDDGAGIDKEALKRKAIERGVTTEEALEYMDDNEIYGLMFEPGISTADAVTSLSGRGVGMDIVKTNIEKLGGSIHIESELGKGTVVRLSMPITLSVTRTLIVTIDSIDYAIPEISIERIIRICNETETRHLERVNDSLVLSLDGQIIPVVTMWEIAAKALGEPHPSADTLLMNACVHDVIKCLIIRVQEKCYALLIDDALEIEQILVKPLPVYLQDCKCYSSVTVLGSGKAVAVLSAEGIAELMEIDNINKENDDESGVQTQESEDSSKTEEKQYVVFKCSGTENYAVETKDISRIEIIEKNDIQEIGTASFVNIAEETIRMIRPETYAPVRKRAYNAERLYLLTLKDSTSSIGLLVGKVLDKIEGVFTLDTEQIYSDYIHGTSVVDEKVLIFLNTSAIAEDVERMKEQKRVAKRVRKGAS